MASPAFAPIGSWSWSEPLSCPPAGRDAAPTGAFGKMLQHYLGQATTQQAQADQAVLDLAMGRTEEVHQVMLAVAKADLTFRTILEVRNRLTEAYQEVIRMQV